MLVVDLIAVGSFPLSLAFSGDILVDFSMVRVLFATVLEVDGESSDLEVPLLQRL